MYPDRVTFRRMAEEEPDLSGPAKETLPALYYGGLHLRRIPGREKLYPVPFFGLMRICYFFFCAVFPSKSSRTILMAQRSPHMEQVSVAPSRQWIAFALSL